MDAFLKRHQGDENPKSLDALRDQFLDQQTQGFDHIKISQHKEYYPIHQRI